MTMVLVDTSVWVSHFRKDNLSLRSLLINDQILCHPLVLLELACGSPPAPRLKTLSQLKENFENSENATVLTSCLESISDKILMPSNWPLNEK